MPPANRQKELETQVEDLRRDIENLNKRTAADKAQMQTAIEMEKRFRAQADAEAATAVARADELLAATTTLQQDKDALELALATSQANEQQTLEQYNAVSSQLLAAQEHTAQLDAYILELQTHIKTLDENIERGGIAETTYQLELTVAVTRANELEAQWAEAQSTMDSSSANLRSELAERDERLASLRAEHEQALVDANAQIAAVEASVASLQTQNSALNGEIETWKKHDTKGLGETLQELQNELFEKSTALVAQGEKLLSVSEALNKCKTALLVAKKDVSDARVLLLRGIAGPNVDVSLYQHVRLDELVRLRLKNEAECQSLLDESEAPSEVNADLGLSSLSKLEREMRLLRSRNKRLVERSSELEKELQAAVGAMDDVKALKEKTAELAGRQRTEKELRSKSDEARVEANEKIVALSEHIEKLMIHLKHEAAAKTKALESVRSLESERRDLVESVAQLTKKMAAKDKTMGELQQGSKILEDQLRLMDEKYIELRNKLDWTRTTSQKEVKKLSHELSVLRCKWQMALDTGQLPTDTYVLKPIKKMQLLSSPHSASDSKLLGSNNDDVPRSTASTTPIKRSVAFEIPKLPQPDSEVGTPWSDTKLDALQRQLQRK
ncbi:hypothetical protein SDRG_09570 [Saprolegnia diclina VS20]|uniref:Uncharacterized protein n=1 Tax=Saprolegnia diclina (strain VS20) TaxID=1156394 RepID=T0QHC8_SAPDV|nr:hypothetical protein SDRG_09570 [Saprolegnia diclina VS20]EQC33050.1 hypothetical protein SDRG_09570 [Saprolegnia diclina VS20]|eukprot:XP_008613736.1 hypothetical protein SDRG_09570 [Saprolegnia diclina VS20]